MYIIRTLYINYSLRSKISVHIMYFHYIKVKRESIVKCCTNTRLKCMGSAMLHKGGNDEAITFCQK